LEFRMQSLGLRVEDIELGFRVQGQKFRADVAE
jgi:hypothetical protein